MTITINDVEIDYTLEKEQSLDDVLNELDSWLRTSGHVIETVRIDGAVMPSDDLQWRERNIDAVQMVALEVRSLREKDLNDLETLRNYFELLNRVLSDGSEDQILSVLEESAYIVAGLGRYLPEVSEAFGANPRSASLNESIVKLLESRQKELLDPEKETRATVTVLRRNLSRIEEVPTTLQSGNPAEAMNAVTGFTELVSKLLRILPLLMEINPAVADLEVEGMDMPSFVQDLNGILTELVESLHGEDYVLLGDLLEYEISPRVLALVDALER